MLIVAENGHLGQKEVIGGQLSLMAKAPDVEIGQVVDPRIFRYSISLKGQEVARFCAGRNIFELKSSGCPRTYIPPSSTFAFLEVERIALNKFPS
jgi:hypothetical protein